MDPDNCPIDILACMTVILLLVLDANSALLECVATSLANITEVHDMGMIPALDRSSLPSDALWQAALNHFRIWSSNMCLDEDLGWWVKPRSTTWFSQFVLHEYDDARWVEMFRFTKRAVFQLVAMLAPAIRKKDTRYRLAVPVAIRIACTLFKLAHGATFLVCSEMFAVGRSTVSIMIRQVVHAINDGLRNEIQWPHEQDLPNIAQEFQNLCGLPGVLGAIDGTHFKIAKPRNGAADYFYFKSGGYTMTCQAVVDSSKRFLDLHVGMSGSTNDSRVLRRSTLFHRGQHQTLWSNSVSFNGFSPYLLGDSGYPLLPWLMVPHRRDNNISIASALFNRKLSRGHSVVENAFALLKLTFRELHGKCNLDVCLVPDVVVCCAILHNILLKDSEEEIARLLDIVQRQNAEAENVEAELHNDDLAEPDFDNVEADGAQVKRAELGAYLTMQRIHRF